MRMKSYLLATSFATSAVFADTGYEKEQKLCPNYGQNREGSMYTDGWGMFVYGDFLYWTAQIDGVDLAYREKAPTQSDPSAFTRLEKLNYHWDPAFRVGLGYYIDSMDWFLMLEWTRFRNDASKSIGATDTTELEPLWGNISSNDFLELKLMKGKWNLHYDTLDLMVAPGFFRYQQFAFRPTYGVRRAWIDWDYPLFQRSIVDEIFITDFRTSKIRNKNHYSAVGFIGGIQAKMLMGMGFHLYGDIFASILYGKFDVKQPIEATVRIDTAQEIFGTLETVTYENSTSYWRVRPNVHMKMGLEWERFFKNNSMRLNLHIGYEFLVWLNQNELHHFYVAQRGDLGINGLTVGGRFEF